MANVARPIKAVMAEMLNDMHDSVAVVRTSPGTQSCSNTECAGDCGLSHSLRDQYAFIESIVHGSSVLYLDKIPGDGTVAP